MNNLRITYTDGYVEPQLSRKDLHDLAPLVAGLAVDGARTLAEIELVKAKTEQIRLQNLEYGSLAGNPDRNEALKAEIARIHAKTRQIARRYRLEPDDLDEEDDELDEVETIAAKKPVRRLVRRSL